MIDGYDMMYMASWGAGHWLLFAFFVAAIAYPVGVILKRLGYSPLWAAVALVPILNRPDSGLSRLPVGIRTRDASRRPARRGSDARAKRRHDGHARRGRSAPGACRFT